MKNFLSFKRLRKQLQLFHSNTGSCHEFFPPQFNEYRDAYFIFFILVKNTYTHLQGPTVLVYALRVQLSAVVATYYSIIVFSYYFVILSARAPVSRYVYNNNNNIYVNNRQTHTHTHFAHTTYMCVFNKRRKRLVH